VPCCSRESTWKWPDEIRPIAKVNNGRVQSGSGKSLSRRRTSSLTSSAPEYSSESLADSVINAHLQFKEGHWLCLLYNKSSPPSMPQSLRATLTAASGDGATSNKTFPHRHTIPITRPVTVRTEENSGRSCRLKEKMMVPPPSPQREDPDGSRHGPKKFQTFFHFNGKINIKPSKMEEGPPHSLGGVRKPQ
jgi:hypothetical protein